MTEESRHKLFQRLEEVLGPEQATTLMEHLPPVGWADVATKRDLEALAVATKRDLDALAVQLRGEMAELRGELRGEIGTLRGEIAGLRAEVQRDVRLTVLAVVGANATVSALAVAAAAAL